MKGKKVYFKLLILLFFSLSFFTACSSSESTLNNLKIRNSCRDFDLSSYQLYELTTELMDLEEIYQYIKENTFIQKDNMQFHEYLNEQTFKVEDGDFQEQMSWKNTVTGITDIQYYNNQQETLGKENYTLAKNKMIEQAEKKLQEIPLKLETDVTVASAYIYHNTGSPSVLFVQTIENVPFSLYPPISGTGTCIFLGEIDFGFYGNEINSTSFTHLLSIKEKKKLNTKTALPQNKKQVLNILETYLKKTPINLDYEIADIYPVYGKVEEEKTGWKIIPMVEIKALYQSNNIYGEKTNSYGIHFYQIDLITGEIYQQQGPIVDKSEEDKNVS